MKVGVISDIHSNFHALEAVILALEDAGIEHLFVLGDIFGYYPWAVETWLCLQRLRWPATFIKGNHDEMLLQLLADPGWNVAASYAGAVAQNLEALRSTPALQWLQSLGFEKTLSLAGQAIQLAHGTPADPQNGRFYPDSKDLPAWFPGAGEWLLLGHTHYPLAMHAPSGGRLINPGSVGQSRDGDPRPAYAILDLSAGEQELRRAQYDIGAALVDLEQRGWEPLAIRALVKRKPLPCLCIRADADERIGIGHVMRCLALAQEWRRRGGSVRLISAMKSTPLIERVRAEGVEIAPMLAVPASAGDLEQTLEEARNSGASWLLLDGYHFPRDYMLRVQAAGLHLLLMDDLADRDLSGIEVVLNQNAYASEAMHAHCRPRPQLLLGTQHTLIRREFLAWRAPRATPQRANRVLVTLGGADVSNFTFLVLQGLQLIPARRLNVRVVIGATNQNIKSLEAELPAVRTIHDCELLLNPPDLPSLMNWSELTITAAGSTCWELCCLGVPQMVIETADNQRMMAPHLTRHQIAEVFGKLDETGLMEFSRRVADLLDNPAERAKLSQAASSLIDGAGARRVVDYMVAKA
jgi:UDP-2,4-diacetamido-2,4,6-trideoxy-beta-L-altropyranose hydrolase